MAQINMKKSIVDIDGKTAMRTEQDKVLLLRTVCVSALLNPVEDKTTGEQKFKDFKLAERIEDNDLIDLAAEEITHLKELVGKRFAPLIVGRSYEILDPSEEKPNSE